jgi:hypothetical protein
MSSVMVLGMTLGDLETLKALDNVILIVLNDQDYGNASRKNFLIGVGRYTALIL